MKKDHYQIARGSRKYYYDLARNVLADEQGSSSAPLTNLKTIAALDQSNRGTGLTFAPLCPQTLHFRRRSAVAIRVPAPNTASICSKVCRRLRRHRSQRIATSTPYRAKCMVVSNRAVPIWGNG